MIENERAKADILDAELSRALDAVDIAAHLPGGAATMAVKKRDAAKALLAMARHQINSLLELIEADCDSLNDLEVELQEAAEDFAH
mmetsp:Transcript_32840/g.94490  ORF Transcript_32840/g.94490 Transcript_32840/m.94490 type:complete len:86 (+) Transcript_32840:2-259(+)